MANTMQGTMNTLRQDHGKFLRKFRRSSASSWMTVAAFREKPLKNLEKLSMNSADCYEGSGPAVSVSAAEMCRIWVQ